MGGIYRRKKTLPDGTRVETGPYWIWYYRNGKQHHESAGTNYSDAKNELKLREGDVAKGVPVTSKVNRLRYEQARDLLLQHHENNLRTGNTVRDAHRTEQFEKLKQRIELHLTSYFAGWKMVSITPAEITRYIAHRKKVGIVNADGERIGDVSNATINRSLQTLKRMFSLAVKSGLLYHRPHIEMLKESSARTGFFEDDQIRAVLRHLPDPLKSVVEFGWRTGWRINSEVLSLQWRNVDFNANEVRLDPGTTKNGQGRVIKMSVELRALLDARRKEADALKAQGTIVPWVFWRMVPKGKRGYTGKRGGKNPYRGEEPKRITTFGKAWKRACTAAGCPGRIPHDLRRTAVRNFIRAGIPQAVAKTLTGHLTDSVFNRYNIVSEGDLADAAQRMSGRHASTR